ncbi:foldase protein PrsA [Actibacterium ureilyticum]|uniref:foldase protein PrsA n=1 Tax=Actibacterium ureilyticum TaxID=1590614 RepID=UPI000BAAAB2D|nr:peptidylprolyl isomerase [Actibacterium ureilyticum]
MPVLPRTALAISLCALISAPAFAQEPAADTVIATVGGEDITLGHMIMMTQQLPPNYQALDDQVLYEAVLDQLIRQTAVAQTMEGELSKAAKLALENERRSFLAGEALGQMDAIQIDDAAIEAAYNEQFADVAPEQEFNASHILVETEEDAKAIKSDLDGGADFAELAKEKSTGPSGPSGGNLGWFGKGMMVAPFEEAVVAMEPGQISDPVQTQFGWHVILLNEARDKPAPTLDEMRDSITAELQQQAVTKALDEITNAADIVRNETEIDPAQLRNMDLLEN